MSNPDVPFPVPHRTGRGQAMTPAERRIADLRLELDDEWGDFAVVSRRDVSAILALAEAVPARMAMSHHAHCRKVTEMLGGQRRRVACTCGHDALAAAWAALGDE